MATLLEAKNLSKKFGNQMVVKNVSIRVEKNSVYGLLGPNGAGKTTLLKIICGMLKQTEGEIIIEGHKWSRADLHQVGALIETPPLYENLTAYENLKVRTLLLELPESRIKEVLKIVELTNTDKKKAGQFSLGMKQRLGIAMALLANPTLLILDEPTNGLDPMGIQELRDLIRSFPKQGITVILSSHILSEVELIADCIGIIANGQLGYENRINANENLEELFMKVVKENNGRRLHE
ncbi:ABC-2 type transport system ATP-binding protein [Natranaerovirga hydrolytica]|uniref:ABC-2 type transport system ATP-binding protein n=1 Tax=Natranaerovirga hydrolytica TaxID=680378 RepID=A0A4R1MPZ7_9FIRM|nr:lantibiotic protection ABC transporter ATP-binding protein [Natranaerovirga hydrolytica]TCK92589.1 ABC-2 type transport system ATP-binding protein [Natranaerovirga hydrolytica]